MLKWVKFLKNYTVQSADGKAYSEGEIVQMTNDSFRHFDDRQVVVEIDAPVIPKEEPIQEVSALDSESEVEQPDVTADIKEPVIEKPKPKRRGRKRKN